MNYCHWSNSACIYTIEDSSCVNSMARDVPANLANCINTSFERRSGRLKPCSAFPIKDAQIYKWYHASAPPGNCVVLTVFITCPWPSLLFGRPPRLNNVRLPQCSQYRKSRPASYVCLESIPALVASSFQPVYTQAGWEALSPWRQLCYVFPAKDADRGRQRKSTGHM